MIIDNDWPSDKANTAYHADIVALDVTNKPVMLVEVKAGPLSKDLGQQVLEELLRNAHSQIPFAMLVDPEKILIFNWDGRSLSSKSLEIPTQAILSFYDPEYGQRRIYGQYMTGLVEGWIRDLAYNWKSQQPPFKKELEKIGLVDRLHGGTTVDELPLAPI